MTTAIYKKRERTIDLYKSNWLKKMQMHHIYHHHKVHQAGPPRKATPKGELLKVVARARQYHMV